MSVHELHLQKKYYDFIKSGTKRIELRLYDEKRAKIQIGDEIVFSVSGDDDGEVMRAGVIGLLRYRSFGGLVGDLPVELLADKSVGKEELLGDLNQFYSVEMQGKYGVVGIRFELVG